MSRSRQLSAVMVEIGIHDRTVEDLNAIAGTREKRPPIEERSAPREWNLVTFATKGYWLCKACKVPTTFPPDGEQICIRCGSARVEFQPPIF
jgi:hypothetical protein